MKKITGKTGLLYRIAEASVKHPKGIINEVIYPVAGEQTLKDLVKEFKSTGLAYKREIHSNMRSSYGNHYRRMLTPILNTLQFRTNNENKHAIIDAIRLLKKYADSKLVYYPNKETVPIDGIVHENTYDIVVEETEDGT